MKAHQDIGDRDTAVAAFIAGVMVGVAAGLLLAPRAGTDLRAALRDYAGEALEDIMDTALRTGKIYIDAFVERGKNYIESAVDETLQPVKRLGVIRSDE